MIDSSHRGRESIRNVDKNQSNTMATKFLNAERAARGNGTQEALTMMAALFGYNTIKGSVGVRNVIDYWEIKQKTASGDS